MSKNVNAINFISNFVKFNFQKKTKIILLSNLWYTCLVDIRRDRPIEVKPAVAGKAYGMTIFIEKKKGDKENIYNEITGS